MLQLFWVQTYTSAAFEEAGAAPKAAAALNGSDLGGRRLRARLVTQA